ncbi:MAG: STAS/SEC14 domain-containing protein, partial [Cyanobium sp.]
MIELLTDLPSGTLGFRCSGRLSGSEMEQVVAPAIRTAIAEYDHLKALLCFEPGLEGFSFSAAWDE